MARTLVTPLVITRTGVSEPTESTGDVSNGNYVPNDGNTVLRIRNANGASTARTLTIRVTSLIDGLAVTSRTVTVAAAGIKYAGPFPVATYGTQLLLDPDNAELRIVALQFS
jgi:hypothetical protein